jgi:hypothetical protein
VVRPTEFVGEQIAVVLLGVTGDEFLGGLTRAEGLQSLNQEVIERN